MSWLLKTSTIIGGLRGLQLEAPFSRAPVILASDGQPDHFLVVSQWLSEESADGTVIDRETLTSRLDSDQALELTQPIPAKAGRAIWIVRSTFIEADEFIRKLRATSAIGHIEEPQSQTFVAVVDEIRGVAVRDQWSSRMFDAAWGLASRGAWSDARKSAELAWLLDRHHYLDRTALFALTLRESGAPSEAEDLIATFANTRGTQRSEELRRLVESHHAAISVTVDARSSESLPERDLELEASHSGPVSIASNEGALVEGLLAGEMSAWAHFHERYSNVMFNAIRKVVDRFDESVADDIYQDLVISLVSNDKRRLKQFDPARGTPLASWLIVLARNAAFDFLRVRRHHRRFEQSIRLEPKPAASTSEPMMSPEETKAMLERLSYLADRDRAFLEYYLALAPEQLAIQLGTSVDAVMTKRQDIQRRAELLEQLLATSS